MTIAVINRPQVINVTSTSQEVVAINRPQIINVSTIVPIANFLSFSFTAISANQTVFTPLPGTPIAVIALYINGTAQNQVAGDFTVNGTTIILSSGVDIGDKVYGIIQI